MRTATKSVPSRAPASARQSAFLISEFTNRTGSTSFRVSGSLDGKRVRENFRTLQAAQARRTALEALRLGVRNAETVQATWLSPEQLQFAEGLFTRIPDIAEVRKAVDFWTTTGRAQEAALSGNQDIRLEDARIAFNSYLDGAADLRPKTKVHLAGAIRRFASTVGNVLLARISVETIESYFAQLTVQPASLPTIRGGLHRFFAWCTQRPQRYIGLNPVTATKIAIPETKDPQIYSLAQVRRLLEIARDYRGGIFLRYIVLQLFGGMRPYEAMRFRNDQIVDGHVRLTGEQTKTGSSRVNTADPSLVAWLAICPKASKTRETNAHQWMAFLTLLGFAWIKDGLRHTAVSYYFRRCGSYGLTADWAGNSEGIIKKHYKARVSAADCEAFWNLFPTDESRAKAQAAQAPAVLPFPVQTDAPGAVAVAR